MTAQQAFEQALQHHRAGRFPQAQQLYRQVLAQQPKHVDALQNLGAIACQLGHYEAAVDFSRQTLALKPDSYEARNNLGFALRAMGKLDEAIAASRQAVALRPRSVEALNNLGIALNEMNRPQEAIAAFRQVIALQPRQGQGYNNLGLTLRSIGRFREAIAAFHQAIAADPRPPEVVNNLGLTLSDDGQLDAAIAAYRQAIGLNPQYAEAFNNLGNALRDKTQLDDAIAAFHQALALKPRYPIAYNNLGNALFIKGLPDEAIGAYRQAIALRPGYVEAYNNLGNALREKGQPDQAINALHRALELNPEFAGAHNSLGSVFQESGQVDKSLAAFRQAVLLEPTNAAFHSNVCFTLSYHPDCDPRSILLEARRWAECFERPVADEIQPHANDRNPDRCLRIGYVSADFWTHSSACFLIPLLEHHDPRKVEITCYSQTIRPDEMTARLQRPVARWRNTAAFSDARLAGQIRDDQIDILVDLKLHTAQNRLPVFARKPAPVQATWLGYPGTTGLDAMDYRLSDPYLDPPGMDESVYSERTVRLPDCFWCYDPLEGRDIPVEPTPASQSGSVTFGCLNNFRKLNDRSLALWARALREAANSRLILLAPEGSRRRLVLEVLQRHEIEPVRIEWVTKASRKEYLKRYGQIDIALDTLPYNGHTTSLDALWMGVPVVTQIGKTVVGRAGLSLLSNLGMTEMVAQSDDEFVATARNLACDLSRLSDLRQSLRGRMERSPLMDAGRFARNMEAAYRQMWRTWCNSRIR